MRRLMCGARHPAFVLAGLLAAAVPPAGATGATADAPCEVHFWAAPVRSAAIYRGSAQLSWQGLTFVNRQMNSALPTKRLSEIILETDFAPLMNLPAVTLFAEEPSDASARAWEAKVRATPSTAACYYEFQVTYLDYREDILVGRKITTGFIVTDYSGRKPVRSSIKTSTSAMIDIFSISPRELRPIAEGAFRNNLQTFVREKMARRRRK